nr:immunoglobulin heavy chain junction region [Mus musculus]
CAREESYSSFAMDYW